ADLRCACHQGENQGLECSLNVVPKAGSRADRLQPLVHGSQHLVRYPPGFPFPLVRWTDFKPFLLPLESASNELILPRPNPPPITLPKYLRILIPPACHIFLHWHTGVRLRPNCSKVSQQSPFPIGHHE